VSWTRSGSWSILPLTGAAMALGVLSRYEVALWLPLLLVGTGLTIRRHRAGAGRLEAAAIVLVVPAVYAIATWAYLNKAITGSSVSFISSQFGTPTPGVGVTLPGPFETVLLVAKVHLLVFPLALPLGLAMLVLAFR
jgi:hypothetical protein